MVKKNEMIGEWFLPYFPENSITGKLTIDNGQGNLVIYGCFENSNKDFDEIIICGNTNEGFEYTLYGCILISSQRSLNNQILTEYIINYTLEGIHLKEEIKYNKISSQISYLDEWLGIDGFNNDNYSEDWQNFKIEYNLPEKIDFKIDEDLDIEISFRYYHPFRKRFTKELVLKQKVYLTIHSKSDKTLKDLILDLTNFLKFLSLAILEEINFHEVSIYSKEHVFEDDGMLRRILLHIPYSHSTIKNKTKKDMIFCYEDIKLNFGNIIKKWYSSYEKLSVPIDLLYNQFSTKGPVRILENEFLNLAQAIESFHVLKNPNKRKIPSEKFKAIRLQIINQSPEHKELIGNALNQANYLTLDERISEMLSFAPKVLIESIEDIQDFKKKFRATRNYYTHYQPELKKNALRGVDLINMTEKLKIILVSAIIIEIGIDKTTLDRLFKEKHKKFIKSRIYYNTFSNI